MLGNETVVSSSMKDNPHMSYYAGIYALSMGVMLILKAVRGVVFVKVGAEAPFPLLPICWGPRFLVLVLICKGLCSSSKKDFLA